MASQKGGRTHAFMSPVFEKEPPWICAGAHPRVVKVGFQAVPLISSGTWFDRGEVSFTVKQKSIVLVEPGQGC